MRRFIKQTALFFFLLLMAAAALVAFCLTRPSPSLAADDYNMAWLDKLARLKETMGRPRRLILIGGSNLAFSMNSERIESETGMTVINTGFNAGMGLGYALASVEPFIQDGDTVALLPEYGQFSGWNGNFNRIAVMIDVERKPPSLLWRRGMYGLPSQFAEYIRWKSFSFFRRREVFSDAVLRRSGFNKYGDFVGHLGKPALPFKASHAADLEKLDMNIFRALSRFFNEVRDAHNSVSFVLSYPSFEQESFDNQREWINLIARHLKEMDIAVISVPEDYRFDRALFYDSAYHLNAEGRELRTERFIRDLVKWQNEPRSISVGTSE